ncbi:disease resistance protein RPS2-like [Brachypodium distachyon]|uniref:disease resistance protein RPS2-like n=1 Tax=Brachypodium distachyon TaxID=15368 RepID=UPI00053001AF|nr:disease resistance protein RPS2-like [Brachypodium distachyon]|eukprot:XP_014756552.1 disease resistance protein RPS2-like [Brachypodium distachyon]
MYHKGCLAFGAGQQTVGDAPTAITNALLWPELTCVLATSLHVYNNSSITSIPVAPNRLQWHIERWCRVERCPKLHTIFTLPQGSSVDNFYFLETFWASQLLTTCYIWDRTIFLTSHTFSNLMFLHLDYCPRLLHVLPIHASSLSGLETLEIVYCGDLREVFPLSPELQDQDTIIEFPELRRIHLHELPTLQRICGRRMYAPKLETIKIRGCWSLRRLPVIGHDTKPPKVDCEKEWWDNLEWDGVEKYHHPSLYEPSHSKYYKAKLPKGSLLR